MFSRWQPTLVQSSTKRRCFSEVSPMVEWRAVRIMDRTLTMRVTSAPFPATCLPPTILIITQTPSHLPSPPLPHQTASLLLLLFTKSHQRPLTVFTNLPDDVQRKLLCSPVKRPSSQLPWSHQTQKTILLNYLSLYVISHQNSFCLFTVHKERIK